MSIVTRVVGTFVAGAAVFIGSQGISGDNDSSSPKLPAAKKVFDKDEVKKLVIDLDRLH